jgi:hypothetical protein
MGLLDDAIREHLELKRRHGANPEEVARQENEALGEGRRAEFARPEGAAPPAEPAAAEAPVEPVAEPEPETVLEPEPEPEAHEPFDIETDEPATEVAHEPAPPAREPAGDEPWLDDDRDEVPADEALDHPRRPGDPAPAAEEPDSEDVLEETPDFLQETPEHDRLWFEQRPPRDFDWDK